MLTITFLIVQVLQVISLKPLRSKLKDAVITEWSGECGTCDRLIYFDKLCLENSVEPQVGARVSINKPLIIFSKLFKYC